MNSNEKIDLFFHLMAVIGFIDATLLASRVQTAAPAVLPRDRKR